jgi:cytochrome P450
VRRYALAREVFCDHERFTSWPLVIPPMKDRRKLVPIELDPPEHTHYRRLLQPLFTPKAAKAAETRLRAIVRETIGALAPAGHCDFLAAFAYPVPARLFGQLVGLPAADLAHFAASTAAFMSAATPDLEKARIAAELVGYFQGFVAHKAANPGEDWISALLASHDARGATALSQNEIVDICYFLVLAGLDTVPNTLGHVFRFLAENASARRTLRDHPARIPDALEELLRLHAVIHNSRTAKVDLDLHGVRIRAGEPILISPSIVNRDPSAFDDPLAVRLDRAMSEHLAFGAGPHRCPGSNLARLELRVAVEEWLARIPEFRLAEDVCLQGRSGATIGLHELPLAWT